jgi:hypothetical protein
MPTTPTVWDWLAWCSIALLPPVVDATWYCFLDRVPQLSDPTGVVVSVLVGVVTLTSTAIWKIFGRCTLLEMTGGLLGSLPLIFKFLRFRAIEFGTIGPVPIRPWNRVALGAIDVGAGVGSAVANYLAATIALDHALSEAFALT